MDFSLFGRFGGWRGGFYLLERLRMYVWRLSDNCISREQYLIWCGHGGAGDQYYLQRPKMKLIRKGTRMYSILTNTCPRCQRGDLFVTSAYDMRHFSDMPEKCAFCGQPFEPEPSFYSGAMYVSHALQVALFTAVYVALRILFNPQVDVYIFITITAAVLLLPVTLRLSRSIYINFFVRYDQSLEKVLPPRTM